MENMTVPLGKKFTVIAGQNATCKSTLLGMIGQPFGLKDKTIFDKPFSTKFSDIFKFSPEHDVPGNHEYQIEFYDDSVFGKNIEFVKSYKRNQKDSSHIRLVTGKTREKGAGNLDFPVIYLGLKRAYPIGELRYISESIPTLEADEIELFNRWYEAIFYLQETTTPVQITAKLQKDTLAVNSDKYDFYANSAGQDNIGQILGALLSFKRLKQKLGAEYKGGLLLIDEFEVTLFPAAQKNLIDLLYKWSGKLDLQIVITTHSMDTLDYIINYRLKNGNDTKVLYFTKRYGYLELIKNPPLDQIVADLNMQTTPVNKTIKVSLYREDPEADMFLKRLLGPAITKNLNIHQISFGGNFLQTIVEKNIPEFRNSLIVLDGDYISKKNNAPNVLCLPGGEGPENVFRKFLDNLPQDDEFWKNDQNYTKQVYSKNLHDLTQGQYNNRVKMKAWFVSQKKYWGRGCNLLFNRWKAQHADEVAMFKEEFINKYNLLAKRLSIPIISNASTDASKKRKTIK